MRLMRFLDTIVSLKPFCSFSYREITEPYLVRESYTILRLLILWSDLFFVVASEERCVSKTLFV